ncbi:MAG: acyl-CoA synthetase FdrA [Spirochaetaceae bacterium]|jgi:FdrA protein|nr:acyl-CoA synthetase FdrA [Spirochaetaceae bacterium]
MITTLIEKDQYFDSVFLMLINSKVKELDGVTNAVVSMGTEMNIELLKDMGFASDSILDATPNDLLVVIESENQETIDLAVKEVHVLLSKKKKRSAGKAHQPKSIQSALKEEPGANLVVISLPGEFAAREAKTALKNDLNVMMFSDNVSVESEIALKDLAVERGLLMMGPDCGTAIINGHPLCFANVVSKGDIGIVAASGTGLQEVSCCIDDFGGGITQAIGTGGRDLKDPRIGGKMMLMGIEALKNDASTAIIVVISKPPAPEVANKVLSALEKTGKPVVVHFIGQDSGGAGKNIHFAKNLEETAKLAVALSKGESYSPTVFTLPDGEIAAIVEGEAKKISPRQKYLRALYTGGTVADEAMILFEKATGPIYSNNQKKKELQLSDPFISTGHTVVDLGDDIYTVGRPHPMIDPRTREERINREAEDPEMAVMLIDIVLGYGSHPDPAGAILDSLKNARDKAESSGGYLPVIASVVGTKKDFQGFDSTKKTLESIGCVVMPSNYQASKLALEIIKKAGLL